jgi:hypothetical protein
VLLLASGDSGYDTALVFEKKNGRLLARLQTGSWSPWVTVPYSSDARQGMVRFRLLDLKPGGKGVQILRSAVCGVDNLSEPADLAGTLVKKLGPFWTDSAIPPTPLDPFWQVGQEEALEGAMWTARAAIESLAIWDWQFFLHKTELVDAAMHQCLTLADPIYRGYDPRMAALAETVFRQAYIDLDKVIGVLLDGVARLKNTVLVVASDHGGGVNNTVCDINLRLRDAGLLAGPDREIDWSRTRAYTKRERQGTEVYVNLSGREPHGIVTHGDYETVQAR